MAINEVTIAKIEQLSESHAEEVSDFIDFLLTRSLKFAESDFDDYLSNLEDYENRLASGEIKW